MTEIILNSLISWRLLPWTRISQRIYILQEKVYKFSRRCDQFKVHKLQDYMINSNDIKLFAVQKIINNLNKYYDKYNKKKYIVKDIEKFYIYINLFSIQKCKKSTKIILEYIKQYLVYICLKPEWEARLEPIYRLDSKVFRKSSYIYQSNNVLFSDSRNIKNNYEFFLSINKNTKYLTISYFIKRIQSLPSIKYYINYWLNYQNIKYYSNIKYIYYSLYTSIFNCLDIIVSYILSNGLHWYLIYTLDKLKKRQ
uniref:hypothetical protein n=1 Tax=Hypnea nidulans TaxID=673449 RepID=UPI0027DA14BB|nr:hypothetical protein REP55_pgp124 [Hypnea nidulans]WCH54512.1 hypothetical protein [Hypnea nidulans]